MKKSLLCLLMLVVLTSSAPTPSINSENGNRFAFLMMNALVSENADKNFVFSPYGIRNCFTYAYAGAANNTKAEIKRTLFFDSNPENELLDYKKSNDELNQLTQSKLKVANSMWIRESASPMKPTYMNLVKKYTNSVGVLKNAAQVNGWVSEKTNGEIKELVDDGEIADVQVLFLNGITLDAQWKYPFSTSKTRQEDFISDKGIIQVPMMTNEISVFGYKDKEVQMVQLPYTDDLSMTIVMPLKQNFVFNWDEKIQKRLTFDIYDVDDYHLWTTTHDNIDLYLPKFKTNNTFDLIPALKKMGMNEAFDASRGDFSQMNKLLYIGLVKQKATIETNEYGTKASAATAIGMYERSIPEVYKFDRPFYYMIHRVTTGEILFMGRIVNPLMKN